MAEEWRITNFFSGEDETPPGNPENEPTQAWIDGWNANMDGESEGQNPYAADCWEYREWLDGWLAASRD